MYHYPSQYSRLKMENWNRLRELWQEQKNDQPVEILEEKEKHNTKWPTLFKGKEEEMVKEEQARKLDLPEGEKELKQYFLDKLLPFQLKWASSTTHEMSFLEKDFYHDERLKYFLQRIPDTFLILYSPIFKLKNHLLDGGEIILISPVGIEVITLLEKSYDRRITAKDNRFWYIEENNVQAKMLSPLISLQRMERIIRAILAKHDVEFPIKKVVLSRTNVFEYLTEPYQTEYVGKEEHEDWLIAKQKFISPFKHNQLKAADLIVKYCETKSFKRPEWQQEEEKNNDMNRHNFL